MGSSGRLALKEKLPKIIKENEINFVVVNGENAAAMDVELQDLWQKNFFMVLM